ncbi:MAG: hypothetical protein RLZZ298_669 [Pseudomonadota bacterium]|jgi:hypothetical protein
MTYFSIANHLLPPLPDALALGDVQQTQPDIQAAPAAAGLDEMLQAALASDSWAGIPGSLAGGAVSPPSASLRDMATAVAGRLMILR